MKFKCYFFVKTGLILLAALFIGCTSLPFKHQILIVTGGHKFKQDSFFAVFKSYNNIEYEVVVQPEANNIYASTDVEKYDALVFYDMVQDITPEQKEAFLALLKRGKGIVFLHHSLVSYENWDEFHSILGGCYHHTTGLKNGKPYSVSSYKHDQQINVKIVDKKHPITKGIKDFTIHDETYADFVISDKIHPLLSTEHPDNSNLMGWTNSYGKSRIVYLQFGHDHFAFENINFRKLVKQAIEWASEDS